jgi:hypothetical protein
MAGILTQFTRIHASPQPAERAQSAARREVKVRPPFVRLPRKGRAGREDRPPA